MLSTPHLHIPLLVPHQAQKEFTINEAFLALTACLSGAQAMDVNTPPENPSEGALYVVGSSPDTSWEGQPNQLALYYYGWRFFTPSEGMLLWINTRYALYVYCAGQWQSLFSLPIQHIEEDNHDNQ